MIHPHGYWTSKGETNTHEFDKPLCDAIIHLFGHVGRIIDIGCGKGDYVKAFLNKGIDCIGYDGSPLTPALSDHTCSIMDFSSPVDIGKFDLVLCLEVGEHIPEQYEKVFIDNLSNASKEFIILSWAIEGQPGIGHVNCRNNPYIIRELQKRGFDYNAYISEYLREESTLPWFKNTLMVFFKK
jgi:2-polyprenyl-3-methyl-5-hydroxy-6-metoxy-1,4-benzoquinol methylase